MRYSKAILNSPLYQSIEKQHIRETLMKHLNKPERALLFCGKRAKDGKLINSTFKCSVVSIERDHEIYAQQLKEVRGYPNIMPLHTSFKEFVQNHMKIFPPFDTLFLDYQGIISESVEEDIQEVFKHKMPKNATVALTLTKGRDGYKAIKDTYTFQNVCNHDYEIFKQSRLAAFSATVIAFAAKAGYAVKCVHTEEYQNSLKHKQGPKMMFWIFKVTKSPYKK